MCRAAWETGSSNLQLDDRGKPRKPVQRWQVAEPSGNLVTSIHDSCIFHGLTLEGCIEERRKTNRRKLCAIGQPFQSREPLYFWWAGWWKQHHFVRNVPGFDRSSFWSEVCRQCKQYFQNLFWLTRKTLNFHHESQLVSVVLITVCAVCGQRKTPWRYFEGRIASSLRTARAGSSEGQTPRRCVIELGKFNCTIDTEYQI